MNLQFVPIEPSGVPQGVNACVTTASVCEAAGLLYQRVGFVPPWTCYLALRDDTVVGSCAFKSPPVAGEIEIAYFTFPPFEGQGIATSMAKHLLELAQSQPNAPASITAQTLPELNASTKILTKLGFQRDGTAIDDEVGEVWAWRFNAPSQ